MIYLNQQKLLDDHYLTDINDLIRIQKALFIYKDIFATIDECAIIWQKYSEALCASWIDVPNNIEKISMRLKKIDI